MSDNASPPFGSPAAPLPANRTRRASFNTAANRPNTGEGKRGPGGTTPGGGSLAPSSSGLSAFSLQAAQRSGMRRSSVLSGHSGLSQGMSQGGPASARALPKVAIHSVNVDGDDGGIEMISASDRLAMATELRRKYKSIDQGQREEKKPLPHIPKYNVDYGVYHFASQTTTNIPSWEDYYSDVMEMISMCENGQCRAACKYRLSILEEKYNLYRILNTDIEEGVDKKRRGGGVLASSMKVDSGIRLTNSMTAMDLLDTITATYKDQSAQEVEVFNVGDELKPELIKLRMLFQAAEIEDLEALTVEGLGLQPSPDTHVPSNYEVFDPTRNKAGRQAADLLRAFLSRDTLNYGDFFAKAITPPLSRREEDSCPNQASEIHVEHHGRALEEWYELAKWVNDKSLNDLNKNLWVIEFPRLKNNRQSVSFEFHQTHLDNMFRPLFEASLLPYDKKNEKLADMLTKVGAFCIRSDEDTREVDFTAKALPPGELRWSLNPSDLYFAYYVWANICSLNALRSRQKAPHNNTFQFRCVAGERPTQLDSLIYGFLLCDNINQGLLLSEQPVLQFLYGINKIGINMSPLSNNGGRAAYAENPFPLFFRRSINVSLSTENPLLFHHSKDPLVEEYSSAARLYKLSPVDVTELARNSVVNSSFPVKKKREWLGITTANYSESSAVNSQDHTCVPNCRLEFRETVWNCERQVIEQTRRKRRGSQASNAPHIPISPSTPPPTKEHPVGDGESSVATTALTGGAGSPFSPAGGGTSFSPTITQQQKEKMQKLESILDSNVKFTRVSVVDGPMQRDPAESRATEGIIKALVLRRQYHSELNQVQLDPNFREDAWTFDQIDGIYSVREKAKMPRLPQALRTYEEFRENMSELREIIEGSSLRGFAQRRLQLLEHRFKLHVAVNHSLEAGSTEERASQNRDFYQATKVDTNVRTETGMTARQLLAFIIAKSNNNGDDIVSQQKNKAPQTLRQLLDEIDIVPSSLTVDGLEVQVDATQELSSMQWTPEAKSRLLGLLLKTDNDMRGRYFAEITKLTFEHFKRDNFTFVEYRLPIYGGSYSEWEKLASWFDTHGMACYNNRWMIQIPRIYGYFRQRGLVSNFAEYLKNIFDPLWEVSLRPTKKPWAPRLFHFLNHVSGFDCVEDEAKVDMPLHMAERRPQDWTEPIDPPYGYYLYHIWANIATLNEFRKSRKYSTFSFRPSCGEAGAKDHLTTGFLLADGINYGVTLRLDPVLQYLFYLSQLGISVSPLSNNTNLLDYLDNPFPKYFRRGLNVSLSTDGPLRYHHTQEPLIEEYSIASKVWKLSPNDMCEIARNSVRQSGFPTDFKSKVSGEHWFLSSSRGNDAGKTHLSDIRVAYRYETYHAEMSALEHLSGSQFPKALHTVAEEDKLLKEMSDRKKLGGKSQEGIIVATHDDVDVQKLEQQQQKRTRELNDLQSKIEELKRQNRQLNETLSEVFAQQIAAGHQRQGTSPIDDDDDIENQEGFINIARGIASQEALPQVESDGEDTDEEEEDEEEEEEEQNRNGATTGGEHTISIPTIPAPPIAGDASQNSESHNHPALVTSQGGGAAPTLTITAGSNSSSVNPEVKGYKGQNMRNSYVAFGTPTAGTTTTTAGGGANLRLAGGAQPVKTPNDLVSDATSWTPTTATKANDPSFAGAGGVGSTQTLPATPVQETQGQRLINDANEEVSRALAGISGHRESLQMQQQPLPPKRASRASASEARHQNQLTMQRMLAANPNYQKEMENSQNRQLHRAEGQIKK